VVEWDEAKRRANIAKHGVDFALIAEIFEGDYVEAQDSRFIVREPRYIALGEFEGKSYIVAYTWRGEERRFISAWEVGRRGKRRYQALFARRTAGDAKKR
jgi:uncharacterized DUF497 family protein